MAAPFRIIPRPADTVGGRIRQARRNADISQDSLADLISSSRDTVSNWERGKFSPPTDMLIRIAKATGFPVTWFVDGLDGSGPGPSDGGVPGAGQYAPWDSNPEPADFLKRLARRDNVGEPSTQPRRRAA